MGVVVGVDIVGFVVICCQVVDVLEVCLVVVLFVALLCARKVDLASDSQESELVQNDDAEEKVAATVQWLALLVDLAKKQFDVPSVFVMVDLVDSSS